MAVSNSYNISTTRNGIITRAYRILDVIGEGENPTTTQYTEAAEALNDLVKEWAGDGMPLWAIKQSTAITLTASTAAYNIGIGQTIAQNAPLKIHQAWLRDTTTNYDKPLLIIPRKDYQLLAAKSQTGEPNQLWYNPPGNLDTGENIGVITLYVAPDSTTVTNKRLYFSGQYPFMDFDAANDVPDFPQNWFNAIKWGLADQLAYQNSLGLAERAMISKKAQFHKDQALALGPEEGSYELQIQPNWGDRR